MPLSDQRLRATRSPVLSCTSELTLAQCRGMPGQQSEQRLRIVPLALLRRLQEPMPNRASRKSRSRGVETLPQRSTCPGSACRSPFQDIVVVFGAEWDAESQVHRKVNPPAGSKVTPPYGHDWPPHKTRVKNYLRLLFENSADRNYCYVLRFQAEWPASHRFVFIHHVLRLGSVVMNRRGGGAG